MYAPLPLMSLLFDHLEPLAMAHDPDERPAGYVRVRLDGIIVAEEPATRFYLDGVLLGEHHLEAELIYADGDTFFPPILDSQTFTVE